MAILLAIDVVSVFGFATFVLHPGLLGQFPWAPPIFAISFSLFAQLQIAISFICMAIECQKAIGIRWLLLFSSAVAISLLMELGGTTLGIPFGKYSYTSLLGWKLFNHVPLLIPLSWFFMSLPSYVLAGQILGRSHHGRWSQITLGSLLLLTWDFTLDPAMSHLTPFWLWEKPGNFFLEMPLSNLLGWFVTGFLILTLYAALKIDFNTPNRVKIQKFKRFLVQFYAVNLLLPVGLAIAGGLWSSIITTLCVFMLCATLAKLTGSWRTFRAQS
jgi:putative membrane protein